MSEIKILTLRLKRKYWEMIQHDEFGAEPVEVFAIPVIHEVAT